MVGELKAYVLFQSSLLNPRLLPDEADSAGRITNKNFSGNQIHFTDESIQQAALAASNFADDPDELKRIWLRLLHRDN